VSLPNGRNPEETWIPDQARNDKLLKTYVVMYRYRGLGDKKIKRLLSTPIYLKKPNNYLTYYYPEAFNQNIMIAFDLDTPPPFTYHPSCDNVNICQ
jgi:hypothetical protein